jgi:hypothetical protein
METKELVLYFSIALSIGLAFYANSLKQQLNILELKNKQYE